MGRPAETRWWVDRSGQVAAVVVLAGAVIAWAMMLSHPMTSMPGMSSPSSRMPSKLGMSATQLRMGGPLWTLEAAETFLAAWTLMMTAMMLPSATPMFALFTTLSRTRSPNGAATRTVAFIVPYLAIWSLTGIPVYAASVWLSHLSDTNRSVHAAAPYLVAAVLVGAGSYQFSRLKRLCLTNCKNPVSFLVHHWRSGTRGAVRMGTRHAAYCLGCCALLMVVLVAAGSMGIAWVLLVAIAVLIEKVVPTRIPASAITGVALITLSAAIIIHPSVSDLP